MNPYDATNLVFAGGGVRGLAYAGAIEALEEAGILENITHVAGTSVGSIAATLLSLHYHPEEFKDMLKQINLKNFEDGWDPLRILSSYGLYKGDVALNWIKQFISKKGHHPDATFEDLHTAGCKELHIYVTDLTDETVKNLNVHTTPRVIVAEAVRASISIPLFFSCWKFTKNQPDCHLYVDGGAIENYPLTSFDYNGEPNPQTLGMYFEHQHKTNTDLSYNEPLKYIRNLFETALHSQINSLQQFPHHRIRSIPINDLGIAATNFGLNEEQKQALIDSGRRAVKHFLASYDIAVDVEEESYPPLTQ